MKPIFLPFFLFSRKSSKLKDEILKNTVKSYKKGEFSLYFDNLLTLLFIEFIEFIDIVFCFFLFWFSWMPTLLTESLIFRQRPVNSPSSNLNFLLTAP